MNRKILILCTGNSCRSQMAHGFMQSFDDDLYVRSAGTKIAKQVNPKAIKTMHDIGIDISNHKPTLVNEYLHQDWDYVITVCGNADESCPVFIGNVKNRLHIGFEDPSDAIGDETFINSEFARIRDLIKDKFFELYKNQIQKQ